MQNFRNLKTVAAKRASDETWRNIENNFVFLQVVCLRMQDAARTEI